MSQSIRGNNPFIQKIPEEESHYSKNPRFKIQKILKSRIQKTNNQCLALQRPTIILNTIDVADIRKQLKEIRQRKKSLKQRVHPPISQRYTIKLAHAILDIKRQISQSLDHDILSLASSQQKKAILSSSQRQKSKNLPPTRNTKRKLLDQSMEEYVKEKCILKTEQAVRTPKLKIHWNRKNEFLESAKKNKILKPRTQQIEKELTIDKSQQLKKKSNSQFTPWQIRESVHHPLQQF